MFLFAVVIVGSCVLGWGCGGGADAQSPPEILYGRDTCRECMMIVSEARYAAGYTDADGLPVAFDDVGCMVRFVNEKGRPPHVLWVADYNNGEWVRAASAWFVQSGDIATPMGSGIVAVSSESSARELAAERSGTILAFGKLNADTLTTGPK